MFSFLSFLLSCPIPVTIGDWIDRVQGCADGPRLSKARACHSVGVCEGPALLAPALLTERNPKRFLLFTEKAETQGSRSAFALQRAGPRSARAAIAPSSRCVRCRALVGEMWQVVFWIQERLNFFLCTRAVNTSSLDATLAYATFRRNRPLLDSGEARVSCLSLWDKLPQRLDP